MSKKSKIKTKKVKSAAKPSKAALLKPIASDDSIPQELKPRLLVIDKNKEVLSILNRVIEEDGHFEAHCVLKEADAWKYLADSGTPSAILADFPTVKDRFVQMMNEQKIPFYLMTAHLGKATLHLKKQKIKAKMIGKPFDIYLALSMISKLIV